MLPDLSDLYEKVEWAIEHDDEARRIQGEASDLHLSKSQGIVFKSCPRGQPALLTLSRLLPPAAGAEAVRRIMTDDQATAYFALVFMHIAELQNGWTWSNGSAVIDVKA